MKKILIPGIVIAILLVVFLARNCFSKTDEVYKIQVAETEVTWTAYKTSDKIPVTGKFEKIIIENSKEASTIIDAVDNSNFKIPVNSINSTDEIRDGKILKSFFGAMLNTSELSGSIEIGADNQGVVKLKMNGITKDIPIMYDLNENLMIIEGTMDINTWGAQAALELLNAACEDLHTGPDGKTVTWSDVKISAKIQL